MHKFLQIHIIWENELIKACACSKLLLLKMYIAKFIHSGSFVCSYICVTITTYKPYKESSMMINYLIC